MKTEIKPANYTRKKFKTFFLSVPSKAASMWGLFSDMESRKPFLNMTYWPPGSLNWIKGKPPLIKVETARWLRMEYPC